MLTPTAYWGIRFGGAVALLLACGAEAPSGLLRDLAGSGSFRAIDGILGVLAFVTAATSVAPLVRSLSVDQKPRATSVLAAARHRRSRWRIGAART